MEFGTNLFGSLRDRLGAGSSRAGSNPALLDWPGPLGRFERNAAATISAGSYVSCRVKPNDLADGKVSPCLAANFPQPNIND